MPTLAVFYGDSHLGVRFGVVDKLHPYGHSGQDVNGWAAGTPIPAYAAGRVVGRGSTSNFGNWVSLDVGDGWCDHYCHLHTLASAAPMGADIPLGGAVGPLGNTGYSKGNHLHGMRTRSRNPELYASPIDPLPFMLAARNGGGSGGHQPTPVEENPVTYTIYLDATDQSTQYVQSLVTGLETHIQDPTHRTLLDRAKDRSRDGEQRWRAEGAVVAGYMRLINPPAGLNVDELVARLDAADDEETNGILAAIGAIGSADADVIAARVQAVLAGDFERVNLNIDDQPTEFRIVPA